MGSTGPRIQAASVGSGTSRARPPVAMRRKYVEVAVGTAVEASTQELERPFVNTIVVGGAGRKPRRSQGASRKLEAPTQKPKPLSQKVKKLHTTLHA